MAHAATSTDDYAIVRVDRPIAGHAAVALRRAGSVATGAPLVVAGHPAGIPFKLAGGANVRKNSHPDYFEANLDTYGGNSGSPVVDPATGTLEGLLVRGQADFDYVKSARCYVSNRCADTGCPGFESVSRATKFAAFVPELAPCATDAECDDGNGCNGAEICAAGSRLAGAAVACDDANACTSDRCVSTGGAPACASDAVTCGAAACMVAGCDPAGGCFQEPVACDGGADGCCSPGCDGLDPDCDVPACVAFGGACTATSDCCSGSCHKKWKTCR